MPSLSRPLQKALYNVLAIRLSADLRMVMLNMVQIRGTGEGARGNMSDANDVPDCIVRHKLCYTIGSDAWVELIGLSLSRTLTRSVTVTFSHILSRSVFSVTLILHTTLYSALTLSSHLSISLPFRVSVCRSLVLPYLSILF